MINFADLIFRKAEEKDLIKILQLLADDILGKERENFSDISNYQKAFLEISESKNDFLMVLEYENQVIATCHLTLMSSLTRKSAKRINIEAVRVDEFFRGKKIGEFMFEKIKEFGQKNEAKILQLTTDKKRSDALRFYQKIGFEASHEGMKLYL